MFVVVVVVVVVVVDVVVVGMNFILGCERKVTEEGTKRNMVAFVVAQDSWLVGGLVGWPQRPLYLHLVLYVSS